MTENSPSHHQISVDLNRRAFIAAGMISTFLPRLSQQTLSDPDTPEARQPVERKPTPPLPPDIPFVTVEWRLPPLADRRRVRADFNNYARREFIIWLALSQPEKLAAAGIGPAEIALMKKKGNVPNGYEVHHKLPIAGGGTNAPSNLILIRADVHDSIHAALDHQVQGMAENERRTVQLPKPDGVFYHRPPADPSQSNGPVIASSVSISESPPLAESRNSVLSAWLPGFGQPKPNSPSRHR